ncbi:MAG: hypothetical protein ACK5IM_11480, partial [Demequina sp.]|uniref:hypothetical protein n=1 Tax=Demequina sp. TaxID=2050685 RepID=UPI003A852DEC
MANTITIHEETDKETGWLVTWCVLSAISGFIAYGNIFATLESSYSSETTFNVGAAFGGALLALVASIPVCVIVMLL